MTDDVLCPTCGHSLAFHKFDYGSCEAPLGGLVSKNMCGCPLTVHTYIQNIQAKARIDKLEQLETNYKDCMDKLIKAHAHAILLSKKIELLESKMKSIRGLIDKAKPFEKSRLGLAYRTEVPKIINEMIFELEKDMNDGQYDIN